MNRFLLSFRACFLCLTAFLGMTIPMAGAVAQEKTVYKCPGNLYTDALSAKEAKDKNCRTLDGAPITVIQSVRPRPSASNPRSASGSDEAGSKVASQDQKARDADARLILEAELKRERDALEALRKAYNNGQPERRGDERQAAKYAERVQEMKDAITRKTADINSIERELAKIGVSSSASSNSSSSNVRPQ